MNDPLITVMLDAYRMPDWQPDALLATANLDGFGLNFLVWTDTHHLNELVDVAVSDLIAIIDPTIVPQPGWAVKALDTFKINGLKAAFGDTDELGLLGLLRPTAGNYPTWDTLLEPGRLWDRHELVDPRFCVFSRYAWDVFGPFHEEAANPIDVFGMRITASEDWAVGVTKASYGREA